MSESAAPVQHQGFGLPPPSVATDELARLHATFTGRPLPKAPSKGYKPSGNEVYLAGFVLESVVPAGSAHVCGAGCYGIEHEVNVAARLPFLNQRTARAIGITLPATLLQRATEVIE